MTRKRRQRHRGTGSLTYAKIKSLAEPGMYRADETLYLRVAEGGSKQFIQRIVVNGKRHDLGLGGWPLVIRHTYQTLCARGKKRKVALVACMRKLLTILNAMLKHRTFWQEQLHVTP